MTGTANTVCFVPSATPGQVPTTLPTTDLGCVAQELTGSHDNPTSGAKWIAANNRVTLRLSRTANSVGLATESWVFCKKIKTPTAAAGTVPVSTTEFQLGGITDTVIGIKIVIDNRRSVDPIVAGLLEIDKVRGVCVGYDCKAALVCPPCPGFVAFCPK